MSVRYLLFGLLVPSLLYLDRNMTFGITTLATEQTIFTGDFVEMKTIVQVLLMYTSPLCK